MKFVIKTVIGMHPTQRSTQLVVVFSKVLHRRQDICC